MKKKRYLPFGYQMKNGEITPHPTEGPLVQTIFSKYLEREALSALAKFATLSGVPYREGAVVWNKIMVCRILDNRKYIGAEGFPPLISAEQFQETASLRAAKAKQYGGSLSAEMKKIRPQICCGACGQTLKRINMRTGYILWECPECGATTDYLPDKLLLQNVTALLNRAIENRKQLTPDEKHCECLSIEVIRLNNEIERQMGNPWADADHLLRLIMDCAEAKYKVCDSGASEQATQLIQERLAGQPLISAFDYDLFSSIAEKILVFSNGSVRLQLQNGKVI